MFFLLLLLIPATAAAQTPVHWSLSAATKTAVPAGGKVTVVASAEMDAGWHLYALTEPPGGPVALTITIAKGGPFSIDGAIGASAAEKKFDPNFNIVTEVHEDRAEFSVPVRVAAGTKPGTYKLPITIGYQTCNERMCLPPRDETISIELKVSAGAPGAVVDSGVDAVPVGPVAEPPGRSAIAPGPSAIAPGRPASASALAASAVPDLAASSRASTLGAYVGLAALMGALSLITPCVFPMVPITVSYFTNRAGRNRREAVTQALIYGLGIILTFTALGFTLALVFGASGLNRFAADPWLNLGVTALFVAFAMSLFGVWELAIPSALLTRASKADSGRGRLVGTLLMGLAFTLTSFTCTAPFLGTLLVVASQGDWQWPLAGMLAFSSIFALPFVVLALVPQLVASLPRSGPWLVAVKATMGLVEIAAAMKFISNVDLVWGWHIFTRPVVLTTWVALSVVLVAYLSGFVRLGPVPKLRRPGLLRLSAVAAGIVLGVWLASGLSGRRLGELEAFLPPSDLNGQTHNSELSWIINDYDAALKQAQSQNRRVLVDFTGYTCTNCRWMEANMFPLPEVTRELDRYVRVRLYTDGKGEMYRRYQDMEQSLLGTVALPYYAVLTAEGRPIVAFGGLTRDPREYAAFLQKGLE